MKTFQIHFFSTANIQSIEKNLPQRNYGRYCKQLPSLLLKKGGDTTMPLIKIIEHFPSTENYEVGQEYDITNPESLIREGKVILVSQQAAPVVEPITPELPEKPADVPVTKIVSSKKLVK